MLNRVSGWIARRRIRKSLDTILATHMLGHYIPQAEFRAPDSIGMGPLTTRFDESVHPRLAARQARRQALREQAELNQMHSRPFFQGQDMDSRLRSIRDSEYCKLGGLYYRDTAAFDRTVEDYFARMRGIYKPAMAIQKHPGIQTDTVHEVIAYCNRYPNADYQSIGRFLYSSAELAKSYVEYGLLSGHRIGRYNAKIAPAGMKEDILRSYASGRGSLHSIASDISAQYGMHVSESTIRRMAKKAEISRIGKV
jgi:hypothetical protein